MLTLQARSFRNTMTLDQRFLSEIKGILQKARSQAYRAINASMVEAYWQIGKRIVEEEQGGISRAEYGAYLIKQLSQELTKEFGKGFSSVNLKNFRKFYLVFPEGQKGYALRTLLTWTHYRSIMRVDNPKARVYYLQEASEQNWSTRQLDRNIHSLYFERLLSSKDKREALTKAKELNEQAQTNHFIKDPYVFEFLDLPEAYQKNEKKIEGFLIKHLQHFLLELGKGFSFVGRQFRISTESSHFYIDLVFYNYILKCFVLFDLKVGKLKHQDIGQMDMYVRMFDDLKRQNDDKPTIGIILCTEKEQTVVKYSILEGHEQLFASAYKLYLPTEEELISEIERERALLEEKRQEEEE